MLASFDAQRLAAAVAKVHVVFLWAAIIKSPRLPTLCVPETVIFVVRPLACQRHRPGLRLGGLRGGVERLYYSQSMRLRFIAGVLPLQILFEFVAVGHRLSSHCWK